MIPVVGLLHLVRVAVDRYLKIRLPRMRKKMPKLPKIVASLLLITPGIFRMKTQKSVSDTKVAYLALFF
jgi:hypothetical protein